MAGNNAPNQKEMSRHLSEPELVYLDSPVAQPGGIVCEEYVGGAWQLPMFHWR